jgi:acetyl esterase
MKTNLLAYPRFISLFLRLKLLNGTSHFQPLPGGVVDEQTALMRQGLVTLGEIPLAQLSPTQARLDMRNSFAMLKRIGGIYEKVEAIRELTILCENYEIPARLYLPGSNTGVPLFVYLHGGGWVLGDLETADNIARFLCRHVNCAVLTVDYRLAPEHVFPAAVEDAYAAVEWAIANACDLGGDPRRVLVGGDSAGGTLTAVVAQLRRQNGASNIAGQVLFYPSSNSASLDTPSYHEYDGPAYFLPRADVEWFLEQYTPDPKDRLDPRVSPLLAEDLCNLPPALVVTAEFDVLRDEGEAYARRLQDAGVNVKLMRCTGMVHGFLSMIGLFKRATMYFEQVAEEIRKMVGD